MKQQDFSDTKYQSFIEQYLFADLDNKSFQGFKMEDVHFDDTSGKSTESYPDTIHKQKSSTFFNTG